MLMMVVSIVWMVLKVGDLIDAQFKLLNSFYALFNGIWVPLVVDQTHLAVHLLPVNIIVVIEQYLVPLFMAENARSFTNKGEFVFDLLDKTAVLYFPEVKLEVYHLLSDTICQYILAHIVSIDYLEFLEESTSATFSITSWINGTMEDVVHEIAYVLRVQLPIKVNIEERIDEQHLIS
jgi:hypothetical protein